MVHMTTPTALFVDWGMKLRFLPAQENRAAHCSGGSNSRNYVIYSFISTCKTNGICKGIGEICESDEFKEEWYLSGAGGNRTFRSADIGSENG